MSPGSLVLGRLVVALLAGATGLVLARTAQNLGRLQAPAAVQLAEQGGLPLGTPAPAFDLPTTAGGRVSLAELRGRVVVLDFWATWCGPCRPALRSLQDLSRRHEGSGVAVVGVCVSSSPDQIAPFVLREALTFPVLLGEETVQAAYRVVALPTLFVLDRQGAIRYHHVGYAPGAEALVAETVARLLAEPAAGPPEYPVAGGGPAASGG
ncbi:MAG: TlpA disulfide reductase family protein [Candidatus Latescibacterota bacterium]